MVDLPRAFEIIKQNIPDGQVQKHITYKNFYIFQVFLSDDVADQYDPFYSVDMNTGEFSDFSIITDGDMDVLVDLFMNYNKTDLLNF